LSTSSWGYLFGITNGLVELVESLTGGVTEKMQPLHANNKEQHIFYIPSGKRLHNYGKSPFLMGKSTISMGHFQ
jgi:hypothetical protein